MSRISFRLQSIKSSHRQSLILLVVLIPLAHSWLAQERLVRPQLQLNLRGFRTKHNGQGDVPPVRHLLRAESMPPRSNSMKHEHVKSF